MAFSAPLLMFNSVGAVGILHASLLLPPLLVGARRGLRVAQAACEGAQLGHMWGGAGGEPHFGWNQEDFEAYS